MLESWAADIESETRLCNQRTHLAVFHNFYFWTVQRRLRGRLYSATLYWCWDIEVPGWTLIHTPPVFSYLDSRLLRRESSSILVETVGKYEFLVNALMLFRVLAKHGVLFKFCSHARGHHRTFELRNGLFLLLC